MPTTVFANRYNSLRDSVNLVLSQSNPATPTYGYGESFSTSGVVGTQSVAEPSTATKVTAQQYEDLYIDAIRCRAHQLGAANVTINDFVIGDYNTNLTDTDLIEESYIQGLETLVADILNDRFTAQAGNLRVSSIPPVSSVRPESGNIAWNGVLRHIFLIRFPNDLARRQIFNAGGEIRFSAAVAYTGSQAKTVDWQNILNTMNTNSFKATETVNNSGVGTNSNIGNYDLNNAYQLVFSTSGGAVYFRNQYNIYAREYTGIGNESAIQFRVDFVDGAPNDETYGIDETVYGSFSSNIQCATPDGEVEINGTTYNTVEIATDPIGTLIRPLS